MSEVSGSVYVGGQTFRLATTLVLVMELFRAQEVVNSRKMAGSKQIPLVSAYCRMLKQTIFHLHSTTATHSASPLLFPQITNIFLAEENTLVSFTLSLKYTLVLHIPELNSQIQRSASLKSPLKISLFWRSGEACVVIRSRELRWRQQMLQVEHPIHDGSRVMTQTRRDTLALQVGSQTLG